jgi:hypothetical protein
MPLPAGGGWSRIAAELTQEDAEKFAASTLFPSRAMPDELPPKDTLDDL